MEVTLKDGRKLVVRDMTDNEDVFALVDYINALIEENTLILMTDKMSPEMEADWLVNEMRNVHRGRQIYLIAEADGKIAGNSSITRGVGREKHTAEIAMGITKEFRRAGLGEIMLKELIKRAKEKWGSTCIYLEYLEGNEGAKALYEKVGFRQVAILPKWCLVEGNYVNKVYLRLED